MANVWDAMKKHEAEKAAAPPAEARAAGSPPSVPGALPQAAPAGSQSTPADPASASVAPLAPSAPPAALATGVNRLSLNGYAPQLVAHHDRGGEIAENMRALRTNLLAQFPEERFCIMVTSAEKGEGKTVSCLNLAFVLAERQERRTVVLDFDLRRRTISGLLHMNPSPGVVDVLRGTARLDDVIRPTVYGNLSVIPAGEVSRNEVGEVLHRPELDEMMAELRRRYDYVLVDTPPVTIAPDACMLGRAVTDALLVVRMYRTNRETVDAAIRLLHAANIRPVGTVLTFHKYYIPRVLYYHT